MPNFSISNGAFMNTDQAAAMVGVHPKTLQRLARSGRITAYGIGKLWRFQANDLWPMLPFVSLL
jgi:excisionase family DNA binding protein